MWLSNTATTAMMYPIAMSVLVALSRLLEKTRGDAVDVTRLRFGTGLMLVIAYAASIGGIATPVGTPPNLIALGQLDALAGVRIPFFQWMLIGAPVMLVMLGVLVALLRWALPPEMREHRRQPRAHRRRASGARRLSVAERNVMAAFAAHRRRCGSCPGSWRWSSARADAAASRRGRCCPRAWSRCSAPRFSSSCR